MRIVIQKVKKARVEIEGETVDEIKRGLLLLVGIEEGDGIEDIKWMCQKITNMRVFLDKEGKMNFSLKDMDGEVLVVSQFTLHASTKKGNRPSFIKSAKPIIAEPLYESFKSEVAKQLDKEVACGVFGANMQVQLINDGPVTILLDSKNKE